jgi:hypothetical protein
MFFGLLHPTPPSFISAFNSAPRSPSLISVFLFPVLLKHKSSRTPKNTVAMLAGSTEIPVQFRTRRPPRRELYGKLLVLFFFSVLCAVVGLNVAPLPLPEAKHGARGGNAAVPVDDVEVFSFSTLSPDERATLVQLGARLYVPYLTPWGGSERPALFFMWHLLYRSIKPDLEHFTADLHNVTVTTSLESTTAGPSTTIGMSPLATSTTEKPHEKLQVVIHVVETEHGYITTSLARFLPETLVFSVVVNSSTERNRPGYAPHHPEGARDDGAAHVAAEKLAYTVQVAAKVERVLANPAAENVTEATQQPGMNRPPAMPVQEVPLPTTTAAVGEGEDVATQPVVTTPTPSSTHLFLCVPSRTFNESYYTSSSTNLLSVNYQVVLSPYIALRAAQTMVQFDATLRVILTRANVASFIALPWLWDDDGGAKDEGGDVQRQRVQLYAKELADFDRWYGSDEGNPLRVLQRALRVPEVESVYNVSITSLGSKRWAGALRELFRVELSKVARADTNTTTTTSTTSTTTTSPGAVAEVVAQTTASPTNSTVSLFGCAARRNFLQCVPRTQHASCERFSDSSFV